MFQNRVDQQESETLFTEIVRQKTRVHFMEDHYFSVHGVARLSLRGWKEVASMHEQL